MHSLPARYGYTKNQIILLKLSILGQSIQHSWGVSCKLCDSIHACSWDVVFPPQAVQLLIAATINSGSSFKQPRAHAGKGAPAAGQPLRSQQSACAAGDAEIRALPGEVGGRRCLAVPVPARGLYCLIHRGI